MDRLSSTQELPNLTLIRDLYELYYMKESPVDGQVSSHWKEYNQKLKFRVDKTGLPVEVAGYGFLASLFKERFPNSSIVLVDLGKILVFQAYYCQKAHPQNVHESVFSGGEIDLSKCDFVYCPAEFLSKASQLTYDVAVNIASMQEMTTSSLVGYFQFLRRQMEADGLLYCCNRERKVLVGGEVLEFKHYPWHPKDVHLVDETCPWHKYYLSFITTANGPRVFGARIPFVNDFDGPTRHRLTRLSRGH